MRLILLLFLFTTLTYAQDLAELEHKLSSTWIHTNNEKHISLLNSVFEKDPFNDVAIEAIKYSKLIEPKLDELLKKYPSSAEPYYLKANFSSLSYEEKLKYLNQSIKIDSLSAGANYYFGEFYYNLFIIPLQKDVIKPFEYVNNIDDFFAELDLIINKAKTASRYQDTAKKAYDYFLKSWNADKKYHQKIYLPLKQLECYIKENLPHHITAPKTLNIYFPHAHFAVDNNNWQCDFAKNYIDDLQLSVKTAGFLSRQLQSLKEPSLLTAQVNDNEEIFRFTWLPTFHNPIIARVVKDDSAYYFHWKIGMGTGGYESEGLKKQGISKLTPIQWLKFNELISKVNYRNMPNDYNDIMIDGESWTFEHKESAGYQAKKTNLVSDDFVAPFFYLMKIANIEITRAKPYR